MGWDRTTFVKVIIMMLIDEVERFPISATITFPRRDTLYVEMVTNSLLFRRI